MSGEGQDKRLEKQLYDTVDSCSGKILHNQAECSTNELILCKYWLNMQSARGLALIQSADARGEDYWLIDRERSRLALSCQCQ